MSTKAGRVSTTGSGTTTLPPARSLRNGPFPATAASNPPPESMRGVAMRFPVLAAAAAAAAFVAGAAFAKLPPLSDDAKAKAAEAAARTAWTDKVGAYQLCQSMERTAQAYRTGAKAAGKEAPPAEATPACADAGPFVYAPSAGDKPLEAAGAHSPA